MTERHELQEIQLRRPRAIAFDGQRDYMWMKLLEEVNVWWVCDEYDTRGDEIVAKYPAPAAFDDEKNWRHYRPLEETPDLFLKFARLYEEPNFNEAALAWSHEYGVPGVKAIGAPSPYSTRLKYFRDEARQAWVILTMYEAALKRDAQGMEALLAADPEGEISSWFLEIDEENLLESELLKIALFGALRMVEFSLNENCRQILVVESDQQTPDPSAAKGMSEFRSLLGAIYLQAYWLMASGGNAACCEQCGRIISLARIHPEGRKRRRDRRFCDDACRQAKHRSKKKA